MATGKRKNLQQDPRKRPEMPPAKPVPKPEPQDPEMGPGLARFFKPEDWWAAAVTFVLSCVVFYRHMAPEVTLQDSGELVTGAFTFGVPPPPR
jgi:hypothetical protein